jgi:hypothetical protein
MSSGDTLYKAPFLASTDLGNATSETQFVNARGAQMVLALPSNNSLANRPFRIRLDGRVATSTNVTFQVSVYFGFSLTLSANTLMFTTNGVTVNATSSNWMIWLDLFWDSTSDLITGNAFGQIANQVVGPGALANTPNANPNRDSSTRLASGPTYGFTATGLFSGSSAGNHAFVDKFSLEVL